MLFIELVNREIGKQGLLNKVNYAKSPYQRRLLNQRWIYEIGSLKVYKYQIS